MFVALSVVHAGLLLTTPSIPVIGLGLWWNANTISHNFIHRPFFRSAWANRGYSLLLSLILGVPQQLWRARHLTHHGGQRLPHWSAAIAFEGTAILGLWAAMLWISPRFLLTVYLPGYAIGMGLCALQGHFEHAGGVTSHYGRVYNLLFFNDGYHVEHHERPGVPWTQLPDLQQAGARESAWPAVLRWLDGLRVVLEGLERIVLRSPRLQRYVLGVHERAFRELLPSLPELRRVTIVGGGMFPRTALILRRLLPGAALTIVDANAAHLELARAFLGGADIEYRHASYDPRVPDRADLVVIPLAFQGRRRSIYERPPAAAVLVHDWMFARHPHSARISWLLVKRLNLVRR